MKRVILALGTCISEHALKTIKAYPDCDDRFDFHYIFGSVDRVASPIPDEVLKNVVLIIQDLGPWQTATHLNEREHALIPGDAVTINIPTLHFNSLWPLLAKDPRNKVTDKFPWGRYPAPWTDRIAIDVVQRYPDAPSRIAAYKAFDVANTIDLDHFHNTQLVGMFVRENTSDLKFAAYVATSFTDLNLYYSHHHPSGRLMLNLVAQIFGHPKFTSIYRGNLGGMVSSAQSYLIDNDPFAGEQVPIHPAVARHFGLKWWSPDYRYPMLGRTYTFEEWIAEYVEEDMPEEATS